MFMKRGSKAKKKDEKCIEALLQKVQKKWWKEVKRAVTKVTGAWLTDAENTFVKEYGSDNKMGSNPWVSRRAGYLIEILGN